MPNAVPAVGGQTVGDVVQTWIENSLRVVLRLVSAFHLGQGDSKGSRQASEEEQLVSEGDENTVRRRIRLAASSVHARNVVDGVAAYVLVKVTRRYLRSVLECVLMHHVWSLQALFPARLALSVFLTPGVARRVILPIFKSNRKQVTP
jgi:hypothetical protein